MKFKNLVAIVVSILLAACEYSDADIDYNLGNDFLDDPTVVFMIDTLSVHTSTTTIDTFSTSRVDRLLVGDHTDAYGIRTSSEAYFMLDPVNTTIFHSTAQYDSVRLILNLDGYFLGDTTMAGQFEVYRLTEIIETNDNESRIYNNATFETASAPLASFSVDYNVDESELIIELPNELGLDFYTMCLNDDKRITEKELFNEYFPGLVIKPVYGQTNFIAGINAISDSLDAPRIRVYYHDITVNDDLYLDFPLENYSEYLGYENEDYKNYRAFNHIEMDYSGSLIDGIESDEGRLASTMTDDVSFLMGGNILRTRIDIPGIDDLYNFGVGSIVKAELTIEPLEGTYDEKSDLPSTLQMSLIDDKNKIWQPLFVVGSTEDYALGNLHYDNEFKSKTHYTYDITNFVKTEYEDITDLRYSLLMTIPSTSRYPTLDKLIIGNNVHQNNKMKLKIYLTNF